MDEDAKRLGNALKRKRMRDVDETVKRILREDENDKGETVKR
jgi:hypothetical protein